MEFFILFFKKGATIMTEQILQVAQRLKEMRELSDMTVELLAQKLQITPGELKAYEAGETDIPASLLFNAATIFDIDLTVLLTGSEARLHRFCLTRAGTGVAVDRRKAYKYQSLAANMIGKNAEPFQVTVEPGDPDAPFSMNSHPGQEFDYVLEGKLSIRIGDNIMTLEPGDCIYYDSSASHGMKALGDKPVKFLAVIL